MTGLGNRPARDVLACVEDLETRLQGWPSFGEDPDGYVRREDDLAQILETRPTWRATVRRRWDGASISMIGLRATSTMGFAQACRNWVAQARRKLEDASA
ncbi:hypothetical protein [Rubellimicrobium aerolatum]|uniref:Uncharacterized protein n=1 Tax=Rubellimicrobium aerolatum TaxID=490979 RepID=A0ABW0SET2_9RHOB|nr:hypothetical protein [Rubellimicrobium aerolatum]MBP1806492.1 hypothetical protein [Rubellimicrobium aerolatum]